MKSNEIRELYLSFFESKNHLRHPSSSLVPDDPTLLTTSAGMVQFKPYFLGHRKPPHTRLTTSQKCLRAVDIEEVGRTPRHHTFFEMLGNFSFGDYFKEDAIAFAWELLTQRYKIPAEKLHISVYKDDEEAANIWRDKIGIASERLYFLGEDDNFWPAGAPSKGPNGPCGPCSEIFYDFGVERGCGRPTCDITCDCNRFIEIWNLVFMQFDRQDDGTLVPLPNKNIDTGSGLERVASVLQGTLTNFETDLFMPIISHLESITGKKYTDNPVPFRVIADHIRGCSFLVADGVFPSNEGRGYLLRKILRRAAVSGREIGIEKPFLSTLTPIVCDILAGHYPEVPEKQSFIMTILQKEEEKFAEALQQGKMFVINNKKTLSSSGKEGQADGAVIFTAYDTYGLPVEESEKIVKELGFSGVDMAGFKAAMDGQKDLSRKGAKMDGSVFVEDPEKVYRDAAENVVGEMFDGYEKLCLEAEVVAIVVEGADSESAESGQTADLILNRTPFYGEKGGQVGDTGAGEFDGGSLEIAETFVADDSIIVHRSNIKEGALKKGMKIRMKVSTERRDAIARHHTATHLLHAALRKTLGDHVVQSGSFVSPEKLRFDFTHHSAVSAENLREIERLVNEQILSAIPVVTEVKSYQEAKTGGAMALFGEKYGAEVRVVKAGDFSAELCGGTHVANTGSIGFVKISDERAIGSSLRRIEAVAGLAAVDYVNSKLDLLKQSASALNVQDSALPASIANLVEEREKLQKEIKKAADGKIKNFGSQLLDSVREVNGVSIVAESFEGIDVDGLRSMYDQLKTHLKSYAVLLGSDTEGKAALILALSDDVTEKGLDACKLIKEIAKGVKGGGGGTPKLAQAGGKEGAKIKATVAAGSELLSEKLS